MKNSQATTSLCTLLAGGALIVAISSAGCASEKAGIAAPAPATPIATTGKSDLPAPAPASIQGAMIYVGADSSITANGKKIKAEEAAGRLRKASVADDTEVKLLSHPNAPFDAVVAVMRNLRENGYTRVSLVVDTKKSAPQPMDK
jgi:biopolymer transport protein ExbD